MQNRYRRVLPHERGKNHWVLAHPPLEKAIRPGRPSELVQGSTLSSLGCILPVGIGGDLQPSVQHQFFHDIAHVALDRVGGDMEPRGNLFVAQSLGDQVEDLSFARRHAHGLGDVRSPLGDGVLHDL